MRVAGGLLALALSVGGSTEEMNASEVRFARQGEWRIAYEMRRPEGGAGAAELPLVLVHGANSNRRLWRRQLTGLRWSGPLLAIDLLGHGESDKPEGVAYDFATLAESVHAVLSSLGFERAVLVGHSNGVPTVREFYRRFPGQTGALVLADGALRAPLTPEALEWMRQTLARPDFAQRHRNMVEQTPRGVLGDADFALVKEAALATPRHVMASGLEAMADPGTWRRDPIEVPVLMIVSKDAGQSLWTDENRVFAESLVPDLEFQVWGGVGHFFPLERPEEFNRRVEAFLDRLER